MRRFIAVALSASVLLGTVSPLAAQIGNSGSYLAARQAGLSRDYSKAAEYFSRALSLDPRNQALMENALSAQASIGRFDRALPVARRMEQEGYANALAHLVFVVHEAQDGDFAAVLDRFDSGQSLGGLIDGLVAGWAAFGEGRVSDALAQFDMVAAERGLDQLGLYHKALALAVAGDYDSAVSILSGEAGVDMAVSQRGVVAFAQMLSQLDRNEDALALLLARFGDHPRYQGMIAQLEAGETIPFDIITSAGDGIAETFYSGAQIFLWQRENMRQADVSPSLIYAQAALQLNPGHIEALMLIASVMEELELYDLAVETYDRVPRQDPAYLEAQIGRAEALRRNERFEASIEALSQLSKLYPENFMVQLTLGDTYGRVEAWEDALTAYNRAISLRDPAQAQDWRTFYARGVALERLKRMEESEADFRAALAIEPENPRVLNYLGYSLVEEGRKLDEALQMIELAVSKRPEDGYIVDSLGWVYYRLGRYEEAVDPMERAAMLMSTDPIVNDHLGDVYWAVGRKIEADFQWRRALSFGPEPEEADRIRRKLEVGLDQVLEEEGADYIPFPDEG